MLGGGGEAGGLGRSGSLAGGDGGRCQVLGAGGGEGEGERGRVCLWGLPPGRCQVLGSGGGEGEGGRVCLGGLLGAGRGFGGLAAGFG